jgi:diguanylate cyclase (GGDEF)-like protein
MADPVDRTAHDAPPSPAPSRVAQEAADAYERSRVGGLFFVAVWLLICITAGENGPREWAIGALFLALAGLRPLVGALRRAQPHAHARQLAATLSIVVFTMTAWGAVTAFALLHPDYDETPTVILFATSAFITAFVHNYPMRLQPAAAGLVAGYATPGLAVALGDRPGGLPIAIGIGIHFAYLLLAARRAHYEYHRAIDLEQELRAQRDLFDRRSRSDGLTGLANRREFSERISAALVDARHRDVPLALLILDLDHFKAVNDERGHAVGDDCLVALGERLRTQFGGADALAARLGGEEFAVVLRGVSLDVARFRAEAFRRELEAYPLRVDGRAVPVTVSVGVGAFDRHAHADADALYRAVDGALYRAKHEGRNRVIAVDDAPARPGPAAPV